MGKDVRQIIIDIITTIAPDADTSNLKDEVPLREQLELDTMDFLDIVLELRKQYGIDVPEGDYKQLETLASCVAYLTPKFAAKH